MRRFMRGRAALSRSAARGCNNRFRLTARFRLLRDGRGVAVRIKCLKAASAPSRGEVPRIIACVVRTAQPVGEIEERTEQGLANERLVELGQDIRIDHRSHAAQGIGLEPQNKIGPAGMRREMRGEDAERAAEHEALARRNGERIIADPARVLEVLSTAAIYVHPARPGAGRGPAHGGCRAVR